MASTFDDTARHHNGDFEACGQPDAHDGCELHTAAMQLEDLQLRNTHELLEHVTARAPLPDDSVTLVLVEQPSTRQRVLAVRRLDVPAHQPDGYAMSELLCDEIRALPIPPRQPDCMSIVVTIIARHGFNTWSHVEKTWAIAWRYSNHFTDAFHGDLIVVTEHGWASMDTHAGGHRPCLASVA